MIIGKIAQAVIKIILPQMAELLVPVKKYCFEDNELDIKLRELEQKTTDQGFRITTLTDMVKSKDEIIDNMKEEIKSMNKILNKVKNMKKFKIG
tara:strand:- start:43 stop:324 length:282 start_codon:yes stop_codon:yes gene_type:complete